MRRHTIVGAEMLAGIPFFADVHPLVRGHHERWDGDGYPDRLAGSAIPLGARIVCVCDSYNAMITDRPYRPAMTPAGGRGRAAPVRRLSVRPRGGRGAGARARHCLTPLDVRPGAPGE